MATQQLKTIPKISVQIWRPVMDKLTTKIEATCLRRDAYLNRVLAVELDHLDAEIAIPNTEVTRDFIARRLDTLDRKLVSLALEPELVERLNDICRRKRLVRDSFFNRLFLLLAASHKMIDLLYGTLGAEWRLRVWDEHHMADTFYERVFTPLDAKVDPLWPLHAAFELHNEKETRESWINPETGQSVQITRSITGEPQPLESVYTTRFFKETFKDVDLSGLNVYLPESAVPGSDAERKSLDELLQAL